jgi:hypothetical protein
MYRDHDIFYFKSSLKGGVDVWAEFLNEYIESSYKSAIRIGYDDGRKVYREIAKLVEKKDDDINIVIGLSIVKKKTYDVIMMTYVL